MKKSRKIKLNDYHEMSQMEMKNVVGGYDDFGGGGDGYGYGEAYDSSSSSASATNQCVTICATKKWGDTCSCTHSGRKINGKCSQNAFSSNRYCSNLNLHS